MAHGLQFSRKAILLIDQIPNESPIVTRKCLLIEINIKVLALIILHLLNVPDALLNLLPVIFDIITGVPFRSPLIDISSLLTTMFDEIGPGPLFRDILLIASADCTTSARTESLLCPK